MNQVGSGTEVSQKLGNWAEFRNHGAAAVVRREVKEKNAANGKTMSVQGNARGSQEILSIGIIN